MIGLETTLHLWILYDVGSLGIADPLYDCVTEPFDVGSSVADKLDRRT